MITFDGELDDSNDYLRYAIHDRNWSVLGFGTAANPLPLTPPLPADASSGTAGISETPPRVSTTSGTGGTTQRRDGG